MVIDIEKENLAAHVDLCAQRYAEIGVRFDKIEAKLEELSAKIEQNRGELAKTIITSALGISGAIISLIITILMKF
jgi:tetrahydromethanopterin S-methyltransferase subunit G